LIIPHFQPHFFFSTEIHEIETKERMNAVGVNENT